MLDVCLCQQVLSYFTSETSENLGKTVEEGDLFLLHADTQKLTEGTDGGDKCTCSDPGFGHE